MSIATTMFKCKLSPLVAVSLDALTVGDALHLSNLGSNMVPLKNGL